MSKINQKIKVICAKVFNLKPSDISDDMSKDSAPEWDSLNNLLLLTEIEKEYRIKFTASDITKIKSIKDIETILKDKGL